MEFNLRSALEKNGATLDENQLKFVSAFENALNERDKSKDDSYATSMQEALRAALGAEEKDKDGNVVTMAAQIRSIAEAMEKMEKTQVRSLSSKEKFQLRKMVEDKHADIIQAIRTGQDFEITFSAQRAAAMFTTTSAVSNDSGVEFPLVENYIFDDSIAKIRYPENFILNVIPNAQVAKVPNQVIRVEEATVEGAVAIVAEGGTKPLQSNTFVRTMTTRNKWAGRIEWTEEFEMDNAMLYSEILTMFEEKVIRAWQNGLIDIIETNATAYTTSVLDGTFVKPDNGLAVIAAQSVLQQMNFTANVAIMNPADIVATMFTQDTEGNSRLLPYMQNGTINGLRVFANNNVTLGTALVGDSTVYKEWHSDFILRFGTYNDQFIKNEKSAIGEVFSLLRIADIDKPAWMLLDLDAVKASLQQA